MSIASLAKSLERFTIAKSPAILTAVAVTGTVTTALLVGKASYKAATLIAEEENRRKVDHDLGGTAELTPMETKEKVALVWTLYIPAASTCTTTVVAMITANQIGTRRTAAMAAAYSLTEKAFGEYREKVVEKIGERKEGAVRDELAQDRVTANPVSSTQVIMTNSGDVLCFDQHSGRYFQSDMETLKKAVNDLNYKMLNESYASLNDFYDKIGLPILPTGEDLGWNTDNKFDLSFSSVMSEDQRPCIAIDFMYGPFLNYYKGY